MNDEQRSNYKKTIKALQVLPEDKAEEISNFAGFMLHKYEDLTLQQDMQTLQSKTETFAFLHDDEDLYSPADIKEKF